MLLLLRSYSLALIEIEGLPSPDSSRALPRHRPPPPLSAPLERRVRARFLSSSARGARVGGRRHGRCCRWHRWKGRRSSLARAPRPLHVCGAAVLRPGGPTDRAALRARAPWLRPAPRHAPRSSSTSATTLADVLWSARVCLLAPRREGGGASAGRCVAEARTNRTSRRPRRGHGRPRSGGRSSDGGSDGGPRRAAAPTRPPLLTSGRLRRRLGRIRQPRR